MTTEQHSKGAPIPSHRPKQTPARWRKFAHLSPYYRNNSLRGIHEAKKLGYSAIDLDWNVTKDGEPVCTHWDRPLKHGFIDPQKRIPSSRKVSEMTLAEVMRLRSKKGSYRIKPVDPIFKHAAKYGLRVEFEAKTGIGFYHVSTFAKVKKAADKHGVHVQVKTLSTLRGAPRRLRAAKEAGLTTIILPRGSRRLKKKDYWGVADYVRGKVFWV